MVLENIENRLSVPLGFVKVVKKNHLSRLTILPLHNILFYLYFPNL